MLHSITCIRGRLLLDSCPAYWPLASYAHLLLLGCCVTIALLCCLPLRILPGRRAKPAGITLLTYLRTAARPLLLLWFLLLLLPLLLLLFLQCLLLPLLHLCIVLYLSPACSRQLQGTARMEDSLL